ncbi:hypothetical protein CI610_00869 [invertebrate metagenome]|uniref:Uncharacterized protein n=1 Tax=invertebrate metagenome TaxID=1711999 RepID=A0A2H9TAC2_9ZZZZ
MPGPFLIFREGYNGKDGSGKSYLATQLAKELGHSVIHFDDYLIKNQNSYFDSLKLDNLRKAITETPKPLIVEGVCLLTIREALRFGDGFNVYVKRMSPAGYWADEDECSISESLDVYIQQKQEAINIAATISFMGISGNDETLEFPALAREIIEYHYVYKPHKISDAIYCRVND